MKTRDRIKDRTSSFLIGWAEVDATPVGVADLRGQYYQRVSTGVHSGLTATVVALESPDGEQAVMVSLELVGFRSDFQEELRGMLKDALPDLDTSKVFLNVTHTHNAPGVDLSAPKPWWTKLPDVMPSTQYRCFLLERAKEAVTAAWRGRRAGGIARALGFARAGHCRRAVYANGTAEMYGDTTRPDFMGMEGGEDSGVDMLFTFDAESKPTGMILNLACPSQVMEATYKISSDFIGETRRLLKAEFGSAFAMLGQISAAGCQSPRDLTRNYKGEPDFWHEDGVAELGSRLFSTVTQALPAAAMKIDPTPILKHVVKPVSLPVRRASEAEYVVAREELAALIAKQPEDEAYADFCDQVARNETIPGRPGPYDSKLHHFVLIQNAKAVLARYEEQDARSSFEMELHVLRLGDAVFATNPFELYLDFGHQIKARSPAAQTFVVQLCGDSGGYLPSERAEQVGGYGGLIINGKVGSGGGKQLVDLTVQEIETLF